MLASLLLFLAAFPALGAIPPALLPPPVCQDGPALAPETRALAERLERHVRTLAGDPLEGRRSGSASADKAAYYIAGALAAAGLEPGGPDGSWFQEFEIELPAEAGECSLVVQRRQDDGTVAVSSYSGAGTVALSSTGSVKAELASAGYGVVMESHGMNEFQDAGVEGHIVLLRRYTEFGPKAEAPFAELGNLRNKIKNAAAAGAVAVILGTHPDDLERGGEAEIPFDAAPGSGTIPVVTVAPTQFAQIEALVNDPHATALTATVTAAVERKRVQTLNVLGLLPGQSEQVVVVGGHYDHLGWGGQGSLAPGEHAIHNGADDNASGTAVVIELAERMAQRGERPRDTLLFALWGAEELGLLGSQHWVKEPTVPLDRVLCNVNLDMVGRLQGGNLTVGSHQTAAGFSEVLDGLDAKAASHPEWPLVQLKRVAGELPGGGGSDHMSFHAAEVPALFFFSGLHTDYHKPSDDWEKLDYERMAVLVGQLEEMVTGLCAEDGSEAFAYVAPAPSPERDNRTVTGARAWFGSIPDYGATPERGMAIAGASPGGPAEKAGLQAGDVILQVGEVEVVDIYDFMDALAKYVPGDVVDVEFLRDGEVKTVPVTLASRGAGQ